MFALVILASLALASAAPWLDHHQHHGHYPARGSLRHRYHEDDSGEIFSGEIFDTRRFWSEMNAEMQKFDQMLTEFYTHFPTKVSQTGLQGDKYVVTINMNDFEENEIKVKAREGVLMVQGIHKSEGGGERSFLDLTTLPNYVNPNGTWNFESGVLKITFLLKNRPEEATEAVVTEVETHGPNHEDRDREEVESHTDHSQLDADVGIDQRKTEYDILTNVIPNDNAVEATTYAVDLKDEVEFVPVKY